jgi:hypothetical protein
MWSFWGDGFNDCLLEILSVANAALPFVPQGKKTRRYIRTFSDP